MRQEWEPINWATKTRRDSDWDADTRLRGMTLLLQGMLLFAVWAGATLLVWGIDIALFGPQRLSRLLIWAGVSGVVLMLAGACMGITGVAIDKITVPSWLNPTRWNWLWGWLLSEILWNVVIWIFIWFF